MLNIWIHVHFKLCMTLNCLTLVMKILFLYLWYAVIILFEWSDGEKKAKDLNMCVFFHLNWSDDFDYGWKTPTESTNKGRVYFYHELIGESHFNLVFVLQINNSETCLF